jgi:hypothetical protein
MLVKHKMLVQLWLIVQANPQVGCFNQDAEERKR